MTRVPKWGRVVAQPNEFLIVVRNGKVHAHGQGGTAFKWPSDSVALLPTSITKLAFRADQVTREKAGVEVTGLAVYRIVSPLVAYKMIDWDRASLTDILQEMFVGATRRIVAGLTLEECITHRKERVAAALMDEIAPVLAGSGSPDDDTPRGWGVALDTIEIQDVRVLSADVFSRLQAPYREELALSALRAHDEVAREKAKLEAEQRVLAEKARRSLMEEEESRILAERARDVALREHQHRLLDRQQQAEIVRERAKAEAEKARAEIALAAKREADAHEVQLLRARREALSDLTPARMQEIMLTETMPQVAHAFRESFGTVNVTSIDGGPLLKFLSAGLEQVMRVGDAVKPKAE